jgi:hypothetical protein
MKRGTAASFYSDRTLLALDFVVALFFARDSFFRRLVDEAAPKGPR